MSECPIWAIKIGMDLLKDLISAHWKAFKSPTPFAAIGDPSFLPIRLTGGIGDVIMAVDALKRLKQEHQIIVYTPHEEALRYFYKEPLCVFRTPQDYTWRLEFDTVVKFNISPNFHGFLLDEHKEIFMRQQAAFRADPHLEKLVKTLSEKYFLLALYGQEKGWDRRDFPLRSLGYDEKIPFTVELREISEKYITIHDGFDVQHASIVKNRATKTWTMGNWAKLVKSLKLHLPGYRIVQLGAITSRKIDGVDDCFLNQTTLTQAFDVLKYSALHIDGDSGLVHAATKMGIPCIVMWGPTPAHFYGYPQNINIRSEVCPSACYGLIRNWNDECVLGYETPRCMDEITPEQVMQAVIHGPR